ncbi:cytosine permease [Aliiroseovarius sp. YM-037]|uniref:cytosine permease n=1 Tax=Aliiroseovarius sp. YM-037 TaxID=3341728 RepID=UPI003A7F7349
MIVDYYLHRKEQLSEADLYSMDSGIYHYENGWNNAAVKAFEIAAIFSVATVWVPWFAILSGFNWVIAAILGGVICNALAKDHVKV